MHQRKASIVSAPSMGEKCLKTPENGYSGIYKRRWAQDNTGKCVQLADCIDLRPVDMG